MKHLFLALIALLSLHSGFAQKNEYSIIPAPLKMKTQSGNFTFNENTRLYISPGSDPETAKAFFILSDHLRAAAGIDLKQSSQEAASNVIICKSNDKLGDEAYTLTVGKGKIVIEARKPAGFFYAAQTIRQLLPAAIESKSQQNGIAWNVPCCRIEDAPQFVYRGMHLDVCRHFSPVDEVKTYIDQIAFLKLNTFHWHLTDDQGWRIEIKKYPKLTEVGGFRNRTLSGAYVAPEKRKWDNTRYGGFYTQEEIKDVIAYARARFVTVIPEIELPGHAVAALSAYPEYSCSGGPFEVEGLWGVFNDIYCSREETFQFLENILGEVATLFPSDYIHIGGDEAPKLRWSRCHACRERMEKEGLKDEHELQSYFITRIGKFLATKGKRIIGWDEILEGGLAPDATVMSWRGIDGGIAAARQHHDVIMTPNSTLYLDFYQSKSPNEPHAIGGFSPIDSVYAYNPIPLALSPEEARHIIGVQANLWTEYIATRQHREYMIFPRITALAEIAWLPKEKKDFSGFMTRLPSLLKHYDVMGVNYRKPD